MYTNPARHSGLWVWMGNNSSYWTSHWAEAFSAHFSNFFLPLLGKSVLKKPFCTVNNKAVKYKNFPTILSLLKKALLHCIKHKKFESSLVKAKILIFHPSQKFDARYILHFFSTISSVHPIWKTKPNWVWTVSAPCAKVIWIGLKINHWRTSPISHDTLSNPKDMTKTHFPHCWSV